MQDINNAVLKFNTRWVMVISALTYLVALNLRPALTSVGPLLPQIGADLKIGEGLQGLLSSLPVLAFGIVSPFVHRFTKNLGTERAILLSMMFLALGIFIRSYTGLVGLWTGTFILGIAIAFANVLLPTLIKQDYRNNISLATSLYSVSIGIAASIAAATAVPLANHFDWRGSLAFWAIPALIAAGLWITRAIPKPEIVDETTVEAIYKNEVSVWKSSMAWTLSILMATQSTIFFTLSSWIPTLEIDRGLSVAEAGLYLSVYQISNVVSGLITPFLMRNPYNKRPATLGCALPLVIGTIGFLALPNYGLIWAVLCGLGTGMTLSVVLTLVSLRGGSNQRTIKLSGMAQSFGYLVATFGPIIFGYLAELTGNWSAPLIFLVVIAIVQLITAFPAGKEEIAYQK
ncbi:MAG: MFS transporter [Micrococcaceae bacterium]